MAGVLKAVLLLTATALVVNSHPLEEDMANIPTQAIREKRNANCYQTYHQADGTFYYRTCSSFCYAQGKHPYCYSQQCMCTSNPGQLPTLPRHQPEAPATPPPLPKRSVIPTWDTPTIPQFTIPNFGQGRSECYKE